MSQVVISVCVSCAKNRSSVAVRRKSFGTVLYSCAFSTSAKNQNEVRVRFAPSPTGFLHLGGLRTALLNYLFAKSTGNGRFILRIEDTDQTRLVPGAVENLLDKLRWVGIEPDEGPTIGGKYGPYIQSERLHIYQRHANKLLENGSAYRCFCSERRIEVLRRDQIRRKEQTRYDNRCRSLTPSEIKDKLHSSTPYVLRLELRHDAKFFNDILNGKIEHDVARIEGDPVIQKTDGYPTYHLANVVDDHLMRVTHILRGKEWMISTCKHVMLYKAFGWETPKFAHLPLLNSEDGKKLSKRQGDAYVGHHREKGYFPAALLNFMSHYGGGFPESIGTVFGDELSTPASTLDIMAKEFKLEKVGTQNSIIRFWKLDQYNSEIMKHLMSTEKGRLWLVNKLKRLVCKKYGKGNLPNDKYMERVLALRQAHVSVLEDLTSDEYDYVWMKPRVEIKSYDKNLVSFTEQARSYLEQKRKDCEISPGKIAFDLRALVEKQNLKMGPAMGFLRTLLIGRKQGPGIGEIICLLGLEETLSRLNKVHDCLKRDDHELCRNISVTNSKH